MTRVGYFANGPIYDQEIGERVFFWQVGCQPFFRTGLILIGSAEPSPGTARQGWRMVAAGSHH
jgi:hypothetical protein